MKLVLVLEIDDGWADEPIDVKPVYIFNNMRECYFKLNQAGYCLEVTKEPSPTNEYNFGEVILWNGNMKYSYKAMYSHE